MMAYAYLHSFTSVVSLKYGEIKQNLLFPHSDDVRIEKTRDDLQKINVADKIQIRCRTICYVKLD